MSSSPTAVTSTTASSSSWPSRTEPAGWDADDPAAGRPGPGRVALVACGALAQPCAEIARRRGWPLDVHPLPPLLHNRPERIAAAVEEAVTALRPRYAHVAVGYADCGTYGALDEVCDRLRLRRLDGLHCYELYGGAERVRRWFEDEPGTYLLTDFLVRSFDRTVWAELGLDRYPELREAYFGGYTRVVWLAQRPGSELAALAEEAARRLGLPLTVVPVGDDRLEQAMATLLPARPAG